MGSTKRPPLWGNFVFYADLDLLAFASLYQGGLRVAGYYHATQAVEKYLKSLALSIIDPNGVTETLKSKKWVRTHNLSALAERCKHRYPHYGQATVVTHLRRFAEFDQLARYPWAEQKHGNGFSSDDLPVFWDLILRLRTDIPIQLDDYPLGMVVRGFHHGSAAHPANKYLLSDLGGPLRALRRFFPDVEKIVRW
jgi:HEPN domain-containing protein